MKDWFNKFIIWLVIIAFLALGYAQITAGNFANVQELALSEFLDALDKGNVIEVKIRSREVTGTMNNGTRFRSNFVFYDGFISELRAHNVNFQIVSSESLMGFLGSVLLSWFPMLLLVGVWIFFMRQMQAGGNKTMGFGKSKARMMGVGTPKITFSDIAGVDEAREELYELVDFLKNPKKFKNLGGKIPRGCLLVGMPGTGKTLLAKAIAGEAGVPFFSISGSEFVEMFVGVGASRVRDMFTNANKNSPCIIFIDEIDAVGRHRGIGVGGGNDEREQTLNQLLVEMDGFDTSGGVIVIAATNRPDVLDHALLRPGRFDRRIIVPLPDIKGRSQILSIHIKKLPTTPDVDVHTLARATPGFSGADLANMVNESALFAARKNSKFVSMADLEYAKDKVMMGAERRSMVIHDDEKKITAYHESGHALVAFYTHASDPLYKATIIPRGQALGSVMRLPERDRLSMTREKIVADITVACGGRVAEYLIFGHDKVTSGASSDIKQATDLARAMVMKWGMGEKTGFLCYDHDSSKGDILKPFAEDTAGIIDAEINKIIQECYKKAEEIIKDHKIELGRLASALIKYETLDAEEIKAVIEGREIRTGSSDQDNNKKSSFFDDNTTSDDTIN